MRTNPHRSIRLLTSLGVCLALAGSLGGCGPDPEKITKSAVERMRQDLDQRVKVEVDRRLRAELPRMEARLRAQLAGKTPAAAPGARPRPVVADPAVEPNLGPKVDPADPKPTVPADPTVTAGVTPDARGLKLKRHLIVKQIKERKPVGAANSFVVADGQVYCYLDAVNPKGPERHLQVAFVRNGKPFSKVKLRVGVGHVWRTWARLRLRPQSVGKWHCTVSNEEGQLISRAEFTIQ